MLHVALSWSSEVMIRTSPQVRCSSRSKPFLPASDFQGSRSAYKKENTSPISRCRLQVWLGYPDEHSCDETNMNFKLRVTGDISRENAVKPNDVFVCKAELKSASDVLLSPLKTNSNSSVLVSPVKTNSNVYRSSTGIQGY